MLVRGQFRESVKFNTSQAFADQGVRNVVDPLKSMCIMRPSLAETSEAVRRQSVYFFNPV